LSEASDQISTKNAMLFSSGRQVLVGLYWRRDSIENISNEKRARIHEYLSFRAAVKTDGGTAAAAHTDESKVRFARQPATMEESPVHGLWKVGIALTRPARR